MIFLRTGQIGLILILEKMDGHQTYHGLNMIKRVVKYIIWLVVTLTLVIIGTGLAFVYGNLDTEYAEGYSHSGFDAIKPGMTMDQVKTLIGEPFYTSDVRDLKTNKESKFYNISEIWVYSRQGKIKTANFFVRIVHFDEEGRVVRTEKDIYVD